MLTPPCLRTAIFSFLASTRRFPHWPEKYARPERGSTNLRGSKADFREVWRERHRFSLPAIFQPIFQILMRHCPLGFIGLGERACVHVGNPGFVRLGGVLGN